MPPEINPADPVSEFIVRPRRSFKTFLISLLIFCFSLIIFFFVYITFLIKAPADFPIDTAIVITSGTSVSAIAQQLDEAGVVKSNLLLYLILVTKYEPKNIKASTYYFDKPLNALAVAEILATGNYVSDLVSFTHFEGESLKKLTARLVEKFPQFSADYFYSLASTSEGMLYPDTYLVPQTFTAEQFYALFKKTYLDNISELGTQINDNPLSEEDIIILASIIEREANSPESMKLVSGILQNRLNIGMPLQVDASMEYVLDKPLKELTAEDLKIDTPYNTYLYRGLPPTAIGNPGIEAIKAVLEPTPSDYMFYITGDDGVFYYAKDFEQHKRNIANNLR